MKLRNIRSKPEQTRINYRNKRGDHPEYPPPWIGFCCATWIVFPCVTSIFWGLLVQPRFKCKLGSHSPVVVNRPPIVCLEAVVQWRIFQFEICALCKISVWNMSLVHYFSLKYVRTCGHISMWKIFDTRIVIFCQKKVQNQARQVKGRISMLKYSALNRRF